MGKIDPSTPFRKPTPKLIENKVIKETASFRARARAQIEPRKPSECCLGLVVVGKGSGLEAIKTADQIARKFIKMLKKYKIIVTGKVETPEPQKFGRYHLNIVIRICIDDVQAILSIAEKMGIVPMSRSRKGEEKVILYTYQDYCSDMSTFGIDHIPNPIWYSLKTLFAKIDGICAGNLREAIMKNKSGHCSAVEARVWRKSLDLTLNRVSKTKNDPTIVANPPAHTYTYYIISDLKNSHFQRLTLKTPANDRPARITLPVQSLRRRHHPLSPVPPPLLTSLPRPLRPHRQVRQPRQTGPPPPTGPPCHYLRHRTPTEPEPP